MQNDINRRLQATQGFDIAAARETIRRIDELAALDSSAPLVAGGRAEVAAKLEAEANALGLRDSRWDEAIALIDAAIELIPGTASLLHARDTLVSEQRSYQAKLAAEREQTLRANLDTLVRSPTYTPEWENGVRRAIQDLEPLSGAQDYLQAIRAKVAEGFVSEARTFLEQNRFDRAEQLLKSSAWFVPEFGAADTLREQLSQARAAFESEQREQELVARINGLKRTFSTELAAEGIVAAKNARQALRALLPANDPFLTTDAPQAIADTYLKMAMRALAEHRFDRAAELAQEGLGEVSNHAELGTLLTQITEERLAYNIARLENVLQNAAPTDAVEPRNTLASIRNDARDDFPAIEANLRKQADQRVAKAGKERDSVIDWIAKIFPNYQPPPVQGPPCTSRLAGYGRQARGRCYDVLPDSRTAGPYLVVVPAGSGVPKPFAITRQEISIGDWNVYCRMSGQCTPRQGEPEDVPITNISVSEALAYAGWLSGSTEHEYRLPSEAEWVFAASAESRGKISPNCLNPQAGTGDTLLEVNRGGQNDYGLMNYVGNAQEWVAGPSGSYTARGGAYRDRLGTCEIDLARPHSGTADEITGFRLVRELDGGA